MRIILKQFLGSRVGEYGLDTSKTEHERERLTDSCKYSNELGSIKCVRCLCKETVNKTVLTGL
jgi:hypothetical protein